MFVSLFVCVCLCVCVYVCVCVYFLCFCVYFMHIQLRMRASVIVFSVWDVGNALGKQLNLLSVFMKLTSHQYYSETQMINFKYFFCIQVFSFYIFHLAFKCDPSESFMCILNFCASLAS